MSGPFKMKQTPMLKTKGGLGKFFKGLLSGKRKQKSGLTNLEKRRAEKKTRKPGESKFQADVRRKQEANKAQKRVEEQSIKLADEKYGEEGIVIKG